MLACHSPASAPPLTTRSTQTASLKLRQR
jgi:hypothetical protein